MKQTQIAKIKLLKQQLDENNFNLTIEDIEIIKKLIVNHIKTYERTLSYSGHHREYHNTAGSINYYKNVLTNLQNELEATSNPIDKDVIKAKINQVQHLLLEKETRYKELKDIRRHNR